ncbi:Transcriptional regulatory protein rprY [hydrothermal vent metagenome]|uniref:Transcriptional regulatory protein rprY n=1 Tax=hydrothermal vent metagenome TaxID=652676 RepID=A0A3B1CFA1_9ZZZZ
MNKKAKILLVEDDPNLGGLIKEFLIVKGYDVDLAQDGEEGLKKYNSEKFDICILDIMLPKMDGFTLAREIRSVDKMIPIIFLTAKSQHEDKIEGFKIGGDDYITKPFSMEELLYRIDAILRRVGNSEKDNSQHPVKIGKLEYDFNKRTLSFDGEKIKLTTKENELLNLLVMKRGETVSRSEALIKIWRSDNYFNSRSMDVYITKLRAHLKADNSIEIINVHGEGFKLIF